MELSTAVKPSAARMLHLSGNKQRLFVALWVVLSLASILSLVLSLYGLHVWDSLPAADTAGFFQMTPDGVQAHADWQRMVLDTGLSLPAYAWIFTASRLVGGLALLVLSVALMRRYSHHLLGVLLAMLLPVLAAAGIWNNPLFGWTVAVAPWMEGPVQVLSWLTWCGAIVVYTFPDGTFRPHWTAILAVLVVPLAFMRSFGLDIPLNPDNWPGLLSLAPDVLVIAGVLVAVLYRRARAVDDRPAWRWYAAAWLPLVIVYFASLLLNNVYAALTGHDLFVGAALLPYILVSEPLWFACEAFLAIALSIAIFRERLLESPGAAG